MSTAHRSRSLVFGVTAVFALTLLAPRVVTAEKDVAVLAPVAAPSVADTSAEAVRAARALAAERVLQTGDIGSLQEEHFLAIVAPGPLPDATVDFGSDTGSRVANAPVAVTVERAAEQTRVLAAQKALLSDDLGSMQEEALIIVVTTGTASDATRSADDLLVALASGTRSESAHLATLVLPD